MTNKRAQRKRAAVERAAYGDACQPSLAEMAGKQNNLGVRSAPVPLGQLFHQLIVFPIVAGAMRWLNIIFAMRAASYERDHVVKVQYVMREDSLIADMAPIPIALKDMAVTYFFGFPTFFEGIAPHVLFFGLRFVAKIVFMVFLSSMFCFCWAIFFTPETPLLPDLRIACVALTLTSILLFAIVASRIVIMNIRPHFGKVPYSFSIFFSMIFGICEKSCSPVSAMAIPAIGAIPIFVSAIFGKTLHRLFHWRIAPRTNLRQYKQGWLDGVIQWSHSCVDLLNRFTCLGCRGACNASATEKFSSHYTTNPLYRQFQHAFLFFSCTQFSEVSL